MGSSVAARMGIWLLNVVVCLGYVLLWIMMPTDTYRQQWRPQLRSDTKSTYFGSQDGATLLLYMFPVMFVAITSSIYLHLDKKSYNHNNDTEHTRKKKKNGFLAKWRRPAVVRGPLGIVSWIELAFFTMFIALLLWSFSTYLSIGFSQITPKKVQRYDGKLWIAKLSTASLRMGLVGNIVLSLLFFPVARGSSVLGFFGLTSEGSIKYHIWLGHIAMTIFTAHGISYIVAWAASGNMAEVLKWDKVDVSNVAGEISLLAGFILWATTYPRIRRKFFELFFYTHYLYTLFVFFYILHVGISYAIMMLPGFYLFLIDRYLRFLQSRQHVRLTSSRLLPSGVALELNFSKAPTLTYTPTSVLFLNVPAISKLQWHPFTVCSSSRLETKSLSVVVKVDGTWTSKLYQTLASSSSIINPGTNLDRLQVCTEGPYGPPTVSSARQFLRDESLVMVSGGSGITPFFSIIREMIHFNNNNNTTGRTLSYKTPKLLLICAFKNSSELTMLDLLLPSNCPQLHATNLDLRIEAYVTREERKEDSAAEQESKKTTQKQEEVQGVWFKPDAADAPISPVLGPNGWLWLAVIISSSFTGFLLFMGILTRYYIYPMDHNTGENFNLSVRSCLHALILCVCIAVSCSTAFLWNKKRNAMEAKKIVNMEGITPNTTPQSSWSYNNNGERELESHPHQSILESTNVHYGGRPDLKRILFDCKGSSVMVLASGPKTLRHEVATICSSGLADNLHFESVSTFSW